MTNDVGRPGAEPLDWRFRSMPPGAEHLRLADAASAGWNLLGGDLLPPAMVLKEEALEHNLGLMASYAEAMGVSLAPHAKTPMAPQLVTRQLAAGAWGATVANVAQARVLRSFGVERVLIANEVVEDTAQAWLADELSTEADLSCFVDSTEQVQRLAATLSRHGAPRPLPVLVELGVEGGRCGCRTLAQAHAVAAAVQAAPALELRGVAGYEGVLLGPDLDASLRAVDAYLHHLRELTEQLRAVAAFGAEEIVVSAGGSVFFDRVAEQLHFDSGGTAPPVRVVLRPGSYLTHDSGLHVPISPFGLRIPGPRLEPALELWSSVISRPQPDLAILGFGKRDSSYDFGLPSPLLVCSDGELRNAAGDGLLVSSLNDHHAYVAVDPRSGLRVGDLVGCGISHPCTAIERWPLLALVNESYDVIGAVRTYF